MNPKDLKQDVAHNEGALASITLVLGGARSGKSRFAEDLVGWCARPVYIATAEALDAEMRDRIYHHRARRGHHWINAEAPIELAQCLQEWNHAGSAVVVDCLTLWLNNLLANGRDITLETRRLVRTLHGHQGTVVFVSNEVGWGIVPEHKLARDFRDHLGRLHQEIAALAQRVLILVAGIPMVIKDTLAENSKAH